MKKWEAFIDEFYGMIGSEDKLVYQPIIETLIALDYTPLRKRTKGFILSFNNRLAGCAKENYEVRAVHAKGLTRRLLCKLVTKSHSESMNGVC